MTYLKYKAPRLNVEGGTVVEMMQIEHIAKCDNHCWVLYGKGEDQQEAGVTVDPTEMHRLPELGDFWYRSEEGQNNVICPESRLKLIGYGLLSDQPITAQ
jgi:hypothetical protein